MSCIITYLYLLHFHFSKQLSRCDGQNTLKWFYFTSVNWHYNYTNSRPVCTSNISQLHIPINPCLYTKMNGLFIIIIIIYDWMDTKLVSIIPTGCRVEKVKVKQTWLNPKAPWRTSHNEILHNSSSALLPHTVTLIASSVGEYSGSSSSDSVLLHQHPAVGNFQQESHVWSN